MTYTGPDLSILPDDLVASLGTPAVPAELGNSDESRETHPALHAYTNSELVRLANAFVSQGPSGRELGWASTPNGKWLFTATTWTDWSELTVEVTIGARPVYVTVDLPLVWLSGGADKKLWFRVYDLTAADVVVDRRVLLEDTNDQRPLTFFGRHAPPAGTRQYRLQYQIDSGGTGNVLCYDGGLWGFDDTAVASLSVVEH